MRWYVRILWLVYLAVGLLVLFLRLFTDMLPDYALTLVCLPLALNLTYQSLQRWRREGNASSLLLAGVLYTSLVFIALDLIF